MKIKIFLLLFLFVFEIQIPVQAENKKSNNEKTVSVKKKKVKFIIGMVKNDGNVIPGANLNILLSVFSTSKIKKQLEKNNPNMKLKPNMEDEKYQINCILVEEENKCDVDKDKYFLDLENWENIIYKDLEKEKQKIIKQRNLKELSTAILETDLNGVAEIELPLGEWYVSTFYKNKYSSIFWLDIPLNINNKTNIIELSNKNATNIINN